MEVADQRHSDAELPKSVADLRHRGRRFVAIDRDAHDLRAGMRQRGDLARGRLDVGRVGIGHRLHDDRRAAADRDATDLNRDRFMTLAQAHARVLRLPFWPVISAPARDLPAQGRRQRVQQRRQKQALAAH
jgi:hypothetical protein